MNEWHPASWQTKFCLQAVPYPDTDALTTVIQQLASFPSLVTVKEILALKKLLGEAALGQRFLLQGGNCAERFVHCDQETTHQQLNILLRLKTQLTQLRNQPIICVGRIAGQYAKPRSYETETKDGVTLLSYRGDMINEHIFTSEARVPDPNRILQGYQCAAQTMTCLPQDFYTSHEALLLPYEQALTRFVDQGTWYNLSTHFPWCGMRTTQPDSAHIEYLRGIANPIALKIGPHIPADTLLNLLDTLNPLNEPGRITLIHRFGANTILEKLPSLVDAVKTEGKVVLWSCDPMHGNTQHTSMGKTRSLQVILKELQQAFEIHASRNSYLGGIHLELTSDSVMECLDLNNPEPVSTTLVDPRLNPQQAETVIQAMRTKDASRLPLHE